MQLSVAHSSAVLSALSLLGLLVAHLRAKKKTNSFNNNIPSSPGSGTSTYIPNMWRNGVKSCPLIFSDELVCGKRVDGRLLANVTGDRESAFCFFFLLYCNNTLSNAIWDEVGRKRLTSANSASVFLRAVLFYFLAEKLFTCIPAPYMW